MQENHEQIEEGSSHKAQSGAEISRQEKSFLNRLSKLLGDRRLTIGFTAAFLLGGAAIASAKPRPAAIVAKTNFKKSKAKYEEAATLYETGKYLGAIVIFKELCEETNEPDVCFFNIAQCYAKLGGKIKDFNFYDDAIKKFEEYIKKVGEDSSDAARARGEIAEIKEAKKALEREYAGANNGGTTSSPSSSGVSSPGVPLPGVLPQPPAIPSPPPQTTELRRVPAAQAGAPRPPKLRERRLFVTPEVFGGGGAFISLGDQTVPETGRLDTFWTAGARAGFHRPDSRHGATINFRVAGAQAAERVFGTQDRQPRDIERPETCLLGGPGYQIRIRREGVRFQIYAVFETGVGVCFRPAVMQADGKLETLIGTAQTVDAGFAFVWHLTNSNTPYQVMLGIQLAVGAFFREYERELVTPDGSRINEWILDAAVTGSARGQFEFQF